MAATRHGPVGDELLVRTLSERTSFAAHVTVVGNLSQAGAKRASSADVRKLNRSKQSVRIDCAGITIKVWSIHPTRIAEKKMKVS